MLFQSILTFFRKLKIKTYKGKKVRQHKKIYPDRDYYIHFRVTINDAKQPQNCGNFYITVPARGIYFAKKKLLQHITSNISVSIIDFETKEQ